MTDNEFNKVLCEFNESLGFTEEKNLHVFQNPDVISLTKGSHSDFDMEHRFVNSINLELFTHLDCFVIGYSLASMRWKIENTKE